MSERAPHGVPPGPPRAVCGGPLTATVRVNVPGTGEQARCRLELWPGGTGRRPVAVLSEIPGNTGLSVSAAFPFLAQQVLGLLPPGLPEPVWIEHWPERAVASVLLERPGPTTDMLVSGPCGGWTRMPLPPGALDEYVNGA